MFRRTLSWLLPALAAFALFACGNSAAHATTITQITITQITITRAAIAQAVIAQCANRDIPPLSGSTIPPQDLAAGWNQWTDDDGPDDIEQAPQGSLPVVFTSSVVCERPRNAPPRQEVNATAQPRGPPTA
jgi:hypothetical protein